MIYAFVSHLRERIKDEASSVADVLASGGAKSFEEYRYLTGIIHGLETVQREINDLMDAFDKE